MKRAIKFSIPIIIISLLAFKTVSDNDRYFAIAKNLDIFVTLFKEVNAYYVEEVNPNELMKIGIDAMLSSLDPYTDYIPEDDIEDYMTMTTGEYGGIGALVDRKDGINTIVMPYKDSPADKAGLKIGDQILGINGIMLNGKEKDEISKLLKGQSNSEVELTVKRYCLEETFIVSLKREKITIDNVPYYGMVDEEIGYIKLTDFTTKAGKEVANAVKKLKQQGASKLILDLRGNPGGLLDEAIKVSNVFIPKGKEIVSTRGKLDSWTKKYSAPDDAIDDQIPLVVLTSRGSASAAEIVAGVIQDYDRGILVGRKTYGKGLVQQTRPLAYNSQLKVTTAKYYIPSGRCIQAIDYSTRNEDGSVGKIADSLKMEFKTVNGRTVYDGGGVDPDFEVQGTQYAQISYSIMRKDLIFNYATEYYYSHDSITNARDFEITDSDYGQFTGWLSDKEYDYTTKLERSIDGLLTMAEEEDNFEEISIEIQKVKAMVLHNKENDLINNADEIRLLLEQEIASRYYLQNGIIETTFNDDPDIIQAVTVLKNQEEYTRILNELN
jgi:carboxyl-terminal processing protease